MHFSTNKYIYGFFFISLIIVSVFSIKYLLSGDRFFVGKNQNFCLDLYEIKPSSIEKTHKGNCEFTWEDFLDKDFSGNGISTQFLGGYYPVMDNRIFLKSYISYLEKEIKKDIFSDKLSLAYGEISNPYIPRITLLIRQDLETFEGLKSVSYNGYSLHDIASNFFEKGKCKILLLKSKLSNKTSHMILLNDLLNPHDSDAKQNLSSIEGQYYECIFSPFSFLLSGEKELEFTIENLREEKFHALAI